MGTPISANALRNLALVGHAGSGKTTISEALAFHAGAVTRRGTIAEGNTLSDYHPDEIARRHSINSTLLTLQAQDTKLNLLDTPGYSDFTGEVRSALHVADTALLTINAHSGIEVGTDTAWDFCRQDQNSVIFVVNKLGHDSVRDWDGLVDEIKAHFGHEVAVVQFPYNAGPGFNKIVDLMKMKLLNFRDDGSGDYTEEDIPQDVADQAEILHRELVEIVAESDDTLMEEFFANDGQLEESHFQGGIHESLAHRKLFPILCTDAEKAIGTKRFLEFIVTNAPAPEDHIADVHGINP
ncbi:MAG TPA: GTP-binding protein, partial [Blastocatellia bacterium]|nr:GTP-binding protein [Blastocatellia bacterium]